MEVQIPYTFTGDESTKRLITVIPPNPFCFRMLKHRFSVDYSIYKCVMIKEQGNEHYTQLDIDTVLPDTTFELRFDTFQIDRKLTNVEKIKSAPKTISKVSMNFNVVSNEAVNYMKDKRLTFSKEDLGKMLTTYFTSKCDPSKEYPQQMDVADLKDVLNPRHIKIIRKETFSKFQYGSETEFEVVLEIGKYLKEQEKDDVHQIFNFFLYYMGKPFSLLDPVRTCSTTKDSCVAKKMKEKFFSYFAKKDWQTQNHRGILLYGPPGSGKTTNAKQVCETMGMKCLFSGTASELNAKYVGEAEKRIKEFGQKARNTPYILHYIFLDEIHSLTVDQNSTNHSGHKVDILTTLLGIIGDKDFPNLVLVCCTSYKERLDKQLLRDGRVDIHILVPPVSFSDRLGQLQKLFPGVQRNFKCWVQATTGFTYAQMNILSRKIEKHKKNNPASLISELPNYIIESQRMSEWTDHEYFRTIANSASTVLNGTGKPRQVNTIRCDEYEKAYRDIMVIQYRIPCCYTQWIDSKFRVTHKTTFFESLENTIETMEAIVKDPNNSALLVFDINDLAKLQIVSFSNSEAESHQTGTSYSSSQSKSYSHTVTDGTSRTEGESTSGHSVLSTSSSETKTNSVSNTVSSSISRGTSYQRGTQQSVSRGNTQGTTISTQYQVTHPQALADASSLLTKINAMLPTRKGIYIVYLYVNQYDLLSTQKYI